MFIFKNLYIKKFIISIEEFLIFAYNLYIYIFIYLYIYTFTHIHIQIHYFFLIKKKKKLGKRK